MKEKRLSFLTSILFSLAIGFCLSRSAAFIAVVDGTSMLPTLRNGDIIFVNKHDRDIKRGDIVAIYEPFVDEPILDHIFPNALVVKRVIGISGDTVTLSNNTIYINDFPAKFCRDDDIYENIVPYGYVYLISDNCEEGFDSRDFGPIPVSKIAGKVHLLR